MSATTLPPSAVDAGLPPGGWGGAQELNPLEAFMWRLEAEPRLRSPMTALEVLDCAPDWERLVAAHEWGSRLVPRFRMRVVEPPLQLGTPEWAIDPNFDLSYHLRRVRLPEPGSFRQALDVAQKLAMAPFDRARPPWEARLIEGLDDGRAAYVLKVHHSVTDGLGGIMLLTLLHSRRREPTPDKPTAPVPEAGSVSGLEVLARQAARTALRAPGEAAAAAARVLREAAAAPLETVTGAARLAASLNRVLTPPPAPPSPLLRLRSLSWHFDTLETTVDELKAAGKAAGGSLNDAFVAALLGGFARYHERMGKPIEVMPMGMPISLRPGQTAMGGNRFAGARFAAPVGVADPVERMQRVREQVLSAREEPALDFAALITPVLNRIPTPLVTRWYLGQSSGLDLQASNVAGIPTPVYMAGAEIVRMFPFGPLPGCAVMATLVSHVGVCCIGVNVDLAAVTEPDTFMRCLGEGLDEVLAVGRA